MSSKVKKMQMAWAKRERDKKENPAPITARATTGASPSLPHGGHISPEAPAAQTTLTTALKSANSIIQHDRLAEQATLSMDKPLAPSFSAADNDTQVLANVVPSQPLPNTTMGLPTTHTSSISDNRTVIEAHHEENSTTNNTITFAGPIHINYPASSSATPPPLQQQHRESKVNKIPSTEVSETTSSRTAEPGAATHVLYKLCCKLVRISTVPLRLCLGPPLAYFGWGIFYLALVLVVVGYISHQASACLSDVPGLGWVLYNLGLSSSSVCYFEALMGAWGPRKHRQGSGTATTMLPKAEASIIQQVTEISVSQPLDWTDTFVGSLNMMKSIHQDAAAQGIEITSLTTFVQAGQGQGQNNINHNNNGLENAHRARAASAQLADDIQKGFDAQTSRANRLLLRLTSTTRSTLSLLRQQAQAVREIRDRGGWWFFKSFRHYLGVPPSSSGGSKSNQLLIPTHKIVSDWLGEFMEQFQEARQIMSRWRDSLVHGDIAGSIAEIDYLICKLSVDAANRLLELSDQSSSDQEDSKQALQTFQSRIDVLLQLRSVSSTTCHMAEQAKKNVAKMVQQIDEALKWLDRGVDWAREERNDILYMGGGVGDEVVVWDDAMVDTEASEALRIWEGEKKNEQNKDDSNHPSSSFLPFNARGRRRGQVLSGDMIDAVKVGIAERLDKWNLMKQNTFG